MQKPGIICLILVLILGSMGTGYAWWSDTVVVEKHVTSGILDLGIRKTEGNYNYGRPGDYEETGFVECMDGPYKFRINGEYYSESVNLSVYGTPSFAPYCIFEVANGGTVPVKTKDIIFEWGGCSAQGVSVGRWAVTPYRGSRENGFGLVNLRRVMKEQLIDPEQTMQVEMQLLFEQTGPAEGSISLPCYQWNGAEWGSSR